MAMKWLDPDFRLLNKKRTILFDLCFKVVPGIPKNYQPHCAMHVAMQRLSPVIHAPAWHNALELLPPLEMTRFASVRTSSIFFLIF